MLPTTNIKHQTTNIKLFHMLPIAWYLLKVMICSGILFGYYWLLLRNKIFHRYNRFYLLAAVVLSLLLPLIQINFWQQDQQHSPVIRVLQAVSSGHEFMNEVIIRSNQQHWSIQQLYPIIYLLISSIFIVLFLRSLLAIRTLLKKYPAQILDKVTFIKTDDKSTPFSFLNFIFWNRNIDPETTTGKQIFKHEVAHVQEKHTHDKLFINIMLIFFWCNPFFWLIRKELNMIHEFIADKKAIEDSDTAAFAAMILQASYPQHRFQLTNNFFYSPIKRRLLMLTKNKNPKVNYIGRVLVLPLAVLVFAAFTFKTKTSTSFDNGKKIAAVIDPVKYPSHVIKDTVPQKPAYETVLDKKRAAALKDIDKDKALMVVNGHIVGRGSNAVRNDIQAERVDVTWLIPSEAIKKYGPQGEFGACEISFTEGATFSTAYHDANKASVFYIGIDNPVTINVQKVKPEDLVVSISEGSISGSNGKYNVKVSSPGEVTIRLSKKDGTKIPASFTCKAMSVPISVNDKLPTDAQWETASKQRSTDTLVWQKADNMIFSKVEVESEFPGGKEGWKNFLIKNLKPATPVDEGWKAGKYTVIIQFIVNKEGIVSDVTATNYKGSETAKHCVDIIKKGPKWIPAMQNGKPVNAYRKQPITFYIEEN